MNPDIRVDSQSDRSESRAERADQPSTFLDEVRKWAHNKLLLAAAVIGISGSAAACDMQPEQDKTEVTENQNELYKGCEPFTMCQTGAVYDGTTAELIGFSLIYRVPDGQEFSDVDFKILGEQGNVIHEEVKSLSSGSDKVKFTEREIPGVSDAWSVEIKVNDKVIKLPTNFKSFDDDDDPIGF